MDTAPGDPLGDDPFAPHQLVFIGGLHRSGTTLLADILGSHPAVSGLTRTGVPMDEGQLIQPVYDPAVRHGGPGRFAFHPEMHLTERSPLVSGESRVRLWNAWRPYWDTDRPYLSEKSPPNLIKGRFLQALFPYASFIMIVRHPIAVCAIERKRTRMPGLRLTMHWAQAHRIMRADLPYLRRVLVLRYEDLVGRPEESLRQVFGFLDLEPPTDHPAIMGGLNDKYLDWWFGRPVRGRVLASTITEQLVADAAFFGYDMRTPQPVDELPPFLSRSVPA